MKARRIIADESMLFLILADGRRLGRGFTHRTLAGLTLVRSHGWFRVINGMDHCPELEAARARRGMCNAS